MKQRARQLISDGLEIGTVILRQKESDPAFLRLILDVVREELDADHPEKHLEALRQFLPLLTRVAVSGSERRDEPRGSDPVHRDFLLPEVVTDKQATEAFFVGIPTGLRNRLNNTIEDALHIIGPVTDVNSRRAVIEPQLALGILLSKGKSTQILGQNQELKESLDWGILKTQ